MKVGSTGSSVVGTPAAGHLAVWPVIATVLDRSARREDPAATQGRGAGASGPDGHGATDGKV